MSIVRRLLPGFIILAVGALTWWGLSDNRQEAPWIEVSAPQHATAGSPFPIRLTLDPERFPWAAQPMFVAVHLHGLSSRHEWHGFVGAAPQPIETSNTVFESNPMVPDNEATKFLFLLVYASPTGGWGARVAAAVSEEIPVVTEGVAVTADQLQHVPVYDRAVEQKIIRRDSTAIRVFLALGWLACGWVFWRTRKSSPPAGSRREPLLPLAAALVAVWELLPLEQFLGDRARAFVAAHDWYDMRGGFQHVATVTIVVGAAATVMLLLRRMNGDNRQLPFIGFILHAGVTLTGFLSLHRLDAVLATSVLSISLMQILQLGALLLASIGTANVLRRSAA